MSDISRLKRALNKHRKRLGIGRWSVELILTEDRGYYAKGNRFQFNQADCYAEVEPRDLSKRKFTVYVNKKALNHKDLEAFVLHELLHALLWKVLALSIEVGEARTDKEISKREKKAEREEHLIIDKLIRALST
jgi:hypothetical protein